MLWPALYVMHTSMVKLPDRRARLPFAAYLRENKDFARRRGSAKNIPRRCEGRGNLADHLDQTGHLRQPTRSVHPWVSRIWSQTRSTNVTRNNRRMAASCAASPPNSRTSPSGRRALRKWSTGTKRCSAPRRVENGELAVLAYDDEHHRIAILNVPGLSRQPDGISGFHHAAFTFSCLRDLLSTAGG